MIQHSGVCEEDTREGQLSEHQIRGWGTVSTAGSRGDGSHERSGLFTDTGMVHNYTTSHFMSYDNNEYTIMLHHTLHHTGVCKNHSVCASLCLAAQ